MRKRQAFIQDLKRNVNGDAELRQLLLNKDHVRTLVALPHAKALMVQHRAVWGQKASRLLQTSDDILLEVTESVKVLYALRKDEENVRKAALAIGGLEVESAFDMEACLIKLAQEQIGKSNF